MGIPAESPMRPGRNRPGIALAGVLFGIVIIGLITAGTYAMTDLDTKASRNREDAAAALRLVHTAQAHALSLFRTHLRDTTVNRLLRGADNINSNADDGMFYNWVGLGDSLRILPTGRPAPDGTYWARIMDDPADGDANPTNDTNWRFLIRCIGQTRNGSRAVVDFVVRYHPVLPAITMNGSSVIQGTPDGNGACGDIHVNGNVNVSGTINVNAALTTNGTPTGSGTVLNQAGASVGVTVVPGEMPIPMMQSSEYCGGAQYVLQSDGFVFRRSDGLSFPAMAGTVILGWTMTSSSPVTWESNGSVNPGSYCVQGNATITGNPGTAGVPRPLSVYAQGSIDISGNPKIIAYENQIVFLADGDLHIRGNSSTTYEGLMYAGSNCQVSGSSTITGQVLCQSGPLPAGAREIVPVNLIEGSPILNYNCAWDNLKNRYRIMSWYQRIGM